MRDGKNKPLIYVIIGLLFGVLAGGIGMFILAMPRADNNNNETISASTAGRTEINSAPNEPVVLPSDASPEQILHVATGSTGASSFSFNPLAGGGDHTAWQTLLWMPPLYFDVDGELQPGLFDSWESNEAFTEWTFGLNRWAKWSDGTPITTLDVKGTWELMAQPDTDHGRIAQYLGNVVGYDAVREESTLEITGLQIVDDHTIRVQLQEPDSIFHWRIATTYMNPVKADQARLDTDGFWQPEKDPRFSGPYMLEAYSPQQGQASMVPNPHWWGDEGPYLEKIIFQFENNRDKLATRVENEEIDVAMAGLPLDMAEAHPGFFRPVKAIGYNAFWLAATVEPTDDFNVRKALILSVDLDAVLEAAYPEGFAQRATQMLDPDVSCYDTERVWHTYDPEAARQALAESQYGGAENLPKIRVTPRSSDPALIAALIKIMEFWEQNLGITDIAFGERPNDFGAQERQINLSRDDVVIRFPDGATYAWVGAHSEGPLARGSMMRGYQNERVDLLLDEALSLPADSPKRCELTQEAQQLFMEDYQAIFFAIPERFINASEQVKNYQQGPDVALIAPWRIYMVE